jgi:nucleoside-diphosphate-sugar epimerase
LRSERPLLRSDGGPRRDYLYVPDAVAGYLRLIDTNYSGAFNFGTGRASSVREVVETILRLMGSNAKPIHAASAGPGAGGIEISEQVLDCGRAQTFLSWSPRYDLESGLAATIAWYRQLAEHEQ